MKLFVVIFHSFVVIVVYNAWLTNFAHSLGTDCQTGGQNGTKVEYFACDVGVQFLTRTAQYSIVIDPDTATCGNPENSYCSSLNSLGTDCIAYDVCNSATPGKDHPRNYMTDADTTKTTTWWQSVNWPFTQPKTTTFPVTIQLSFGKLYELTNDITITFKSGRPEDMVLEKSMDYGQNWTVLQYYSSDCSQSVYSSVAGVVVTAANPTAVICTEEYSGEMPRSGGVLKFPLFRDRYEPFMGPLLTNYEALYTALDNLQLREFLSFTDLRFRLIKPAVDDGFLFAPEVQYYNYYYGISDLEISGRCDCNLHGSNCEVIGGETVCQCEHNTQGKNCEQCQPLYNERAWQRGSYLPLPDGTTNECVKCQCNEHADSCRFEPGLGVGGEGICINCTHNTQGNNCDQCIEGFFPNTSTSTNDMNYCTNCDCEPLGVNPGSTSCSQTAIGINPIGQCVCKSQVTGRRCDRCLDTMYGLLSDEYPGECKPCTCNLYGTAGQSNICEQTSGQCPCKTSTNGRPCNQCKDGYYNFPSGSSVSNECDQCSCNWGGATDQVCDKDSGQCSCQANITGLRCDTAQDGYYFPLLDSNVYEPGAGTCSEYVAVWTEQNPFDGRGFVKCPGPAPGSGESYTTFQINGQMMQPKLEWPYRFAVRYSHNSVYEWPSATMTLSAIGNVDNVHIQAYQSKQQEPIVGVNCPQQFGANPRQLPVSFSPGIGRAWVSSDEEAFVLDARCQYDIRLDIGAPHINETNTDITIDSLLLIPSLTQYEAYQGQDNDTKAFLNQCINDIAALSTKNAAVQREGCKRLTFWVGTQINSGVSVCDCDSLGTEVGTVCQTYGGQCRCKPGVFGRRCDVCEPGYFNFTETGCTACDCDSVGSVNGVCNSNSGQCPCFQNVARFEEVNTEGAPANRKCQTCKVDHYGFSSGYGCSACGCNTDGSRGTQCDMSSGQCPCKDTITGRQCGDCLPTYYRFDVTGCLPCNCTAAGVTSPDCNQLSGACGCRSNVEGDKCDQCKTGFFNLDNNNPDGCQPCFCYGHGLSCASAPNYVEMLITADNAQSWEAAPAPIAGVYVQAPVEFLGNLMYAYGQKLSLSMMARFARVSLANYRPIILQGNGMQIFFTQNLNVTSLQYLDITIPLHEHNWYMYENATQRPSASQLYGVLAALDAIYIQRSYDFVTVDIRSISLQTAKMSDGLTSPEVTYVESCECNPSENVAGLSCESCAEGHQRSTNPVSQYDACMICDCNGKQDGALMCEEDTGICLNCRNGTTGDHCESCASHVINAPECDTCEADYWGLFAQGCIACNCSEIGSFRTSCDLISGNCDCKSHVTGQQCDRCEDNYFNLADTGCEVCNDCYTLVQDEVYMLQQMKDNLTNYVQMLRADDNNTDLGPFTERLQTTLTELQDLLKFLTDSKTVEESVALSVSQLNNTLNGLLGNLQADAARVLEETISSLAETDLKLAETRAIRDGVNSTTYSTLSTLQGPFKQTGLEIDALVRSLSEAFQKYNQVAGSTQREMERLTQEVTTIESSSQNTLNLSRVAAETAKASLDNHGVTTNRVTQLERLLITLDTQLMSVKSQAVSTMEEVVLEGTAATDINQRADELGRQSLGGVLQPYTFSPDDQISYQTDAARLKANAVNLNNEANSATQNNGIANRVNQAVDQSAALLGTSQDRLSQSESLLSQAQGASYTASNASSSEKSTFTSAQQMLTTMSNFDTIKSDLEAKTSEALATVQQVQARSQSAIETADGIRANLSQPFTDSKQALTNSNTAKQIQQTKLDQIIPVRNHADQLQFEASVVLNDLDQREARVGNANETIGLGYQTCQNMQPNLVAIKNKSEDAKARTEAATRDTTTTKTEAEKLLNALMNVQELDVARIQELKLTVIQLQGEFDQQQLAVVIGRLQELITMQQEWIDQAEQRKEKLKTDIAMLEVTQSLLVNNRGNSGVP